MDQLAKVIQQELESADISDIFKLNLKNDAFGELVRLFRQMVFYIEEQSDKNNSINYLQEQIKNNQAIIVECLQYFLSVNQELCTFSKLLYEQDCPLEVYKCFRKFYQTMTSTSNSLYQYQSQDDNFLQRKEELISQNLSICEEIFKNPIKKTNDEIKFNPESDELIQQLRQEIDALNDIIRQNDQQYGVQIQRYNHTMYNLQETIREYQLRMDKVRDYQTIIDDLEHKLIRFKEEKYRDDMLIDNMSKKIRLYEKQRGGTDTFLSPRNNSRKMMLSPGSYMANSSMMINPYQLAKNQNMKMNQNNNHNRNHNQNINHNQNQNQRPQNSRTGVEHEMK